MSPNQHGFVVLRTPQLSASFLNRSAVVANATNKFDARRVDPGLPAKFRLGDGSLGDSSSSPLTRPSSLCPRAPRKLRLPHPPNNKGIPVSTHNSAFKCLLRFLVTQPCASAGAG